MGAESNLRLDVRAEPGVEILKWSSFEEGLELLLGYVEPVYN
jgi:hypothetical protein